MPESYDRPAAKRLPFPSVAVVVATRHRSDLLDRCLCAVHDQSVSPSVVIVIDNSAGDEATRAVVRARGASYVAEPRRGVSRARNLGAREATSDVVAFLDDDAVPNNGWLAALLLEFSDPHVAAVTGRVLALDIAEGESCSPRGTGRPTVVFGGPTKLVFDRTTADWFERANFGGVGHGANFAIRRNVFASWDGFDERLGLGTRVVGAEEHHAFFRLIDRGLRVVYTPAASVHHRHPCSDTEARRLRLRQVQSTSAHVALLLAEAKGFRWRTARYVVRVIAGRPGLWRAAPRGPELGAWDVARARLIGVRQYLRTRLAAPGNRR